MPRLVCLTSYENPIDLDCGETAGTEVEWPGPSNANPVPLGTALWNCYTNRYEVTVRCLFSEIDYDDIDLAIYYEQDSYGDCFAVLESEALDLLNDGNGDRRILVPFDDYSDCRCPQFTFVIDDYRSVTMSPYDEESVGPLRCVDRGPNECNDCRCWPRELCAEIVELEELYSGDFGEVIDSECLTLEWYEDNSVQHTCCCNANQLPEILLARPIPANWITDGNGGNLECSCAYSFRGFIGLGGDQIFSHGFLSGQAGAILHLIHREEYDAEGNTVHIWENDESDLANTVFCSIEPDANNNLSETLTIFWQVTLKCTTDGWEGEVRFWDDNTPYEQASLHTFIPQDIERPGCQPFHLTLPGITEDQFCYDLDNEQAYNSLIDIWIQEFIGWTGTNPFDPYQQVTMYPEHIPTATDKSFFVDDCILRFHFSNELYDGTQTLRASEPGNPAYGEDPTKDYVHEGSVACPLPLLDGGTDWEEPPDAGPRRVHRVWPKGCDESCCVLDEGFGDGKCETTGSCFPRLSRDLIADLDWELSIPYDNDCNISPESGKFIVNEPEQRIEIDGDCGPCPVYSPGDVTVDGTFFQEGPEYCDELDCTNTIEFALEFDDYGFEGPADECWRTARLTVTTTDGQAGLQRVTVLEPTSGSCDPFALIFDLSELPLDQETADSGVCEGEVIGCQWCSLAGVTLNVG